MTTITVKNLPDDLYTELKEMAKANRRSINSEVIICIEQRLRHKQRKAGDIVQKARRVRRLTDHHPITEAQLEAAKIEGRR